MDIKDILSYFKKSSKIFSKELPYSYDDIYSDDIKSEANKIGNILPAIPKEYPVGGKKRIFKSYTINLPMYVYTNKKHQAVEYTDRISSDNIMLGITDSEEGIKDTRIQGGGIKKFYLKEQYYINEDVYSYTDIGYWDGYPTGLQNVIIMDIPKSVLNTYTEDKVKEIVNRYTPAGKYVYIRYYE